MAGHESAVAVAGCWRYYKPPKYIIAGCLSATKSGTFFILRRPMPSTLRVRSRAFCTPTRPTVRPRDYTRYPNWWVPPKNNKELVTECDHDRRLLNDAEFQNDVLGLARKGIEALGLGGQYTVRKAVVTEVGPASLCLRCICDFLQAQGSSGSVLMDVPLPFGGEPRRDQTHFGRQF